jgi:hypothetical protein
MRSLQLLRSRTNNDNLGISIEQYQSPIILYNQSGYNIDDAAQRAEAARLNLAVTFNSRSPKQIGGLSLMRKVLLKRRIPNSKKWGEWETVQTEKAEVVGNCEVLGGQR